MNRRIAFPAAIAFGAGCFLLVARFGVPEPAPAGLSEQSDDPDLASDEPESPAALPHAPFADAVAPFIARHCLRCHAGAEAAGGIRLAFADESAAAADRPLWGKIAAAVRSGRMPPAERPRPNPDEARTLIAWADRIAATDSQDRSNPGRVTLRRLNRAEYDNTIRDLIGIDFRAAADFPADDSGDGFDTNGDVLSVSPLLIEKYLAAAEAIVGAAARDPAVWQRLTKPPAEDFVPYVLRGTPPLRADAAKDLRPPTIASPAEAERAAALGRAYLALQAFADRAFRRPVRHVEMGRLMKFVDGADVEAGFQLALTAVLVSPHFLFRVELDPPPGAEPDRRLNDFELASRLSYFLWSSLPDEELYRLAAARKLGEPKTLVAQVRRMLRDPKASALAQNFAGQWLQTRALAETTRDPDRFPEFDAELKRAMRRETELFFDDIVRGDRNTLDLLTGEYTFVNDRLARHYGIPGIEGGHFRRLSLAGRGRAGVVTHASVLTVTSGPTRTSPVKRGKWILETLLGAPSPPPPSGVDGLKDDGVGSAKTMREQLEHHRARADCAACHARLDPLGFGLENYDAVGAWRETDKGTPVDSSGVLPDGRTFRGSAELRAVLAEKPEAFIRCLAEKLLTYALGRSLRPIDRPALERIVRHAGRNGNRFSSLVIAMVRSDPFQMRRMAPEEKFQ